MLVELGRSEVLFDSLAGLPLFLAGVKNVASHRKTQLFELLAEDRGASDIIRAAGAIIRQSSLSTSGRRTSVSSRGRLMA
jgi:hypothetical protein